MSPFLYLLQQQYAWRSTELFVYYWQYYFTLQSYQLVSTMNDKPLSPELKTQKSNFKSTPKQLTFGVTQTIIKSILSNQFTQASQLCSYYNNVSLQKINQLCYEYFLLKYVLGDKKIIVKQDKLLSFNQVSKQLEPYLRKTIQYKTFWQNNAKYLQEIDTAIKEITNCQKFDPKMISGSNEYLLQIKQSLYQAHTRIFKLKQKQKQLSRDIDKLNIVYNNYKVKSEDQFQTNILHLRKIKELVQQYKMKNLELQRKIRESKDREEQQARKGQTIFLNLQSQLEQLNGKVNYLQNQKQNLIRELSQANTQNQRISKRFKQISFSEKNYDNQRKEFLKKMQQKKQTINSLISELESTNQMISNLQESERNCQNIVDQQRNKNYELQLNCQNLENNIKQLNKTNKQLELKVQEQTAQIEELKTQKYQLQLKCQALQNEINNHLFNYQTQSSNISQLQEQQQQLKQNLATQQTQKSNMRNKIEELQTQIFHYQTSNQRLQKQIRQLGDQNNKLNQHIDSLNLQLQKLTEEFHQLQIQNYQSSHKSATECIDQCWNTILSLEDLNNIQNKVIDDQQTINKYRQKIEALELALQHQEQQKEKTKSKSIEFQAKYLTLTKQIDLAQLQRTALFFNGRILDEEPQARAYLQQVIEQVQHKKIRKTTLLYQLQTLNKINVHRYIDSIPNLVLVIKTEAGWLVGAYSQGPFYPKMISDKNGIIISITGRSFYELRVANKRAIAYDDFFVIFGNSEIRIKTQEYKLFSNFGISSSYYDHKEQKVEVITGQRGVREVTIQGFQFFQVEFY